MFRQQFFQTIFEQRLTDSTEEEQVSTESGHNSASSVARGNGFLQPHSGS